MPMPKHYISARRTGRTTRMLQQAITSMLSGNRVTIITSLATIRPLVKQAHKILFDMQPSYHIREQIRGIDIFITGALIPWGSITFEPLNDPKDLLGQQPIHRHIDHHVIEDTLKHALEELHRYDT